MATCHSKPPKTYSRGSTRYIGSSVETTSALLSGDETEPDEPPRKRRTLDSPGSSLQSPSGIRFQLQHTSADEPDAHGTVVSYSNIIDLDSHSACATSILPVSNAHDAFDPHTPKNLNRQRNHADISYMPQSPSASSSNRSIPIHNSGTRSSTAPLRRIPTVIAEPGKDTQEEDSKPPKKLPKDLSEIFDTISPGPSPSKYANFKTPRTRGLTKRMSPRSLIEDPLGSSPDSVKSSSEGPPTVSRNSSSGSQALSSKPVKSSTKRQKSECIPFENQRTAVSTSSRTYAGRSRSFLVALPAPSLLGPHGVTQSQEHSETPPHDDDESCRESYSDLRKRWGVDNSEDDPQQTLPGDFGRADVVENVFNNHLSSITELRSKGESRRFLDEVGYLFEGLTCTSALGVKRSSALEVVAKLCHTDFMRKAKAADFFNRAWELLRNAGAGNGDKVLDGALVFFVALSADDPRDLADIASKDDFVQILFKILKVKRENDHLVNAASNDNADLKKAGITKAEKIMLVRLRDIIQKSMIVHEKTQLSTRVLISHTLCALPSLSFAHLSVIVSSLLDDLADVVPRIPAYASGLPLLPLTSSQNLFSLQHLDNCLRIVDYFLLECWDGEQKNEQMTHIHRQRQLLGEGLMALIAFSQIAGQTNQSNSQHELARNCLENALRILVNLTNDDADWCRTIIDDPLSLPTIIRLIVISNREWAESRTKMEARQGAQFQADGRILDQLCLALGVLTNLVQEQPEMIDILQTTTFDSSCIGERTCIPECRCPGRVNAIVSLVSVYMAQFRVEYDEEPESHILRGHLAILFGFLMRDSPFNQGILLDALPGTSRRKKIDDLIKNASEFIAFYADLGHRLARESEHREFLGVHDNDVDRVTGLSTTLGDPTLRFSNGDVRCSAIAAEVIKSLRALRNAQMN